MAKVSHLPGRAEHQWNWQMAAACRGVGTEVFFHPEGERGQERAAREEAAKAVCESRGLGDVYKRQVRARPSFPSRSRPARQTRRPPKGPPRP
nr:WhiB family transcriptional regulator [Streptomyces bikiniensis]